MVGGINKVNKLRKAIIIYIILARFYVMFSNWLFESLSFLTFLEFFWVFGWLLLILFGLQGLL